MFAMLHDILEGDAAVLDVALLHVRLDGWRVADLPREWRCAGGNGIDGKQNGYRIPLHPGSVIRDRLN
jgi:hypothetical protein